MCVVVSCVVWSGIVRQSVICVVLGGVVRQSVMDISPASVVISVGAASAFGSVRPPHVRGKQPRPLLGFSGSPWQMAPSPQSSSTTQGKVQKCRSVWLKSMVQRMAFLLSLHSPPPLVQGIPMPREFPHPARQGLEGVAVQLAGFSGSFSCGLASWTLSWFVGGVHAKGKAKKRHVKKPK